jgi:hypothetical protein
MVVCHDFGRCGSGELALVFATRVLLDGHPGVLRKRVHVHRRKVEYGYLRQMKSGSELVRE